jgi:hypothetical protein
MVCYTPKIFVLRNCYSPGDCVLSSFRLGKSIQNVWECIPFIDRMEPVLLQTYGGHRAVMIWNEKRRRSNSIIKTGELYVILEAQGEGIWDAVWRRRSMTFSAGSEGIQPPS